MVIFLTRFNIYDLKIFLFYANYLISVHITIIFLLLINTINFRWYFILKFMKITSGQLIFIICF